MDKLWVRNITTNNIDEVGSLSFGAARWEEAYQEMLNRGYKFEIGEQYGNNGNYWGLYLINPLDIKIEDSEYYFINDLNKRIKSFQESHASLKASEEQKSPKLSLNDLLENLERCVRFAKRSGLELQFAPEEAIERIIKDQENAYDAFIEGLKESEVSERQNILKKVFSSSNLTDNIKLGIYFEITNLSDNLKESYEINDNLELNKLFNQLEKSVERAKRTGIELQFAPEEAINTLIKDQEEAYNALVEALKECSIDERQSIIQKVFGSSNLTDNIKLAIIFEINKISEKIEKNYIRR